MQTPSGACSDITMNTMAIAAERAAQLASAIKAVGIKAGGRVGIYAPNVPNWMLVIQACNRSSLQVGKLAQDKTWPLPIPCSFAMLMPHVCVLTMSHIAQPQTCATALSFSKIARCSIEVRGPFSTASRSSLANSIPRETWWCLQCLCTTPWASQQWSTL